MPDEYSLFYDEVSVHGGVLKVKCLLCGDRRIMRLDRFPHHVARIHESRDPVEEPAQQMGAVGAGFAQMNIAEDAGGNRQS